MPDFPADRPEVSAKGQKTAYNAHVPAFLEVSLRLLTAEKLRQGHAELSEGCLAWQGVELRNPYPLTSGQCGPRDEKPLSFHSKSLRREGTGWVSSECGQAPCDSMILSAGLSHNPMETTYRLSSG